MEGNRAAIKARSKAASLKVWGEKISYYVNVFAADNFKDAAIPPVASVNSEPPLLLI